MKTGERGEGTSGRAAPERIRKQRFHAPAAEEIPPPRFRGYQLVRPAGARGGPASGAAGRTGRGAGSRRRVVQ